MMEMPIKMVRRLGSAFGREFGRGIKRIGSIDVEILSIGPLFQELDRRWLEIKKPRFYSMSPLESLIKKVRA